jgi:hypothetical protein
MFLNLHFKVALAVAMVENWYFVGTKGYKSMTHSNRKNINFFGIKEYESITH